MFSLEKILVSRTIPEFKWSKKMPDSDRELSDLKSKDQCDEGLAPSGSGQGNGRQNLVKYGELVILGYNGQLPQGNFQAFFLLCTYQLQRKYNRSKFLFVQIAIFNA